MMLLKAMRNLKRDKLHTGIILLSLSIGITCINLIGIFIYREFNTDHFHSNVDQIYAVQVENPFSKENNIYYCREGASEYMKDNFPQVVDYCRYNNGGVSKISVGKDVYFEKPSIITASENFFDFFSFNLITNNPKSVLLTDNSIVISKELSEKYFGTTNAVGKTITFNGGKDEKEMEVTGIFEKPSENTALNFDMVRLLTEKNSKCFIQLKEGVLKEEAEALFLENKNKIPIIHSGGKDAYMLSPFSELYFDAAKGNYSIFKNRTKIDIWIALSISILILIIACFNYLGLLNNQLQKNRKYFTIELINGGNRLHLTQKIMIENLILMLLSFVFSLFLLIWVLPYYNELTSTDITVEYILNLRIFKYLFIVPSLIICTTYIFVFFRIDKKIDIKNLKGNPTDTRKKVQLPVFNIFQLTGSIILIICSITIIKQIKYIHNKPIGLNKNVIEIRIPHSHTQLADVFKEKLQQYPTVDAVSRANSSPLLEYYLIPLSYNEDGEKSEYLLSGFFGDNHYISTMGIEILEGNDFSENEKANQNKCLVNESFARKFSEKNLIGSTIPGMPEKEIIGIVKDFHYVSLKSTIEPAHIYYSNNCNYLMVKPIKGKEKEVTSAINKIWKELIPGFPVVTESVAERYDWMHQENGNFIKLISSCCVISIFLSMIGLFAIAYQNCQFRLKEISIRKINGAKVHEIIALLNSSFAKWIIISFLIAAPATFYLMNHWLENFAYHTNLDWWLFALSGIITGIIAIITISGISLKTANQNPVDVLRNE